MCLIKFLETLNMSAIVTLISSVLALIGVIVSVLVNIKLTNKNITANVLSIARKERLDKMQENMACFLNETIEIANSFADLAFNNETISSEKFEDKLFKYDKFRLLIILNLEKNEDSEKIINQMKVLREKIIRIRIDDEDNQIPSARFDKYNYIVEEYLGDIDCACNELTDLSRDFFNEEWNKLKNGK